MKILVVSPKNRTVYNFRGNLIKKMISLGHEVFVTGPNKDSIDKIKALGATFLEVPLDKTGLSVIADINYMKKLKRIMIDLEIDLVFSYTIKPVIYGSIAAKQAGIRNVVSMITGLGYVYTEQNIKVKILRQIVSRLYKYSLKFNRTVIFQNPDDQNQFVDLGIISKEKTELVSGSGVDMEHFVKTTYPDEITFIMLSRVLKSKGVEEYLKAAEYIKNKYPHIKFLYLGNVEEMKGSFSSEAFQIYIDRSVIEHYSETDDVREFIRQGSVFVLPSYREGTPRSVLEAMSMGRAIITTDAPGCRETVEENRNGFLVNKMDYMDLALKMEEFINNPELIKQMGHQSYLYCKERFEVNLVNEAMINILKIEDMGK